MQKGIIKVLIVDDSVVARRFLAEVIESDPKIKVIGFASDGVEALKCLEKMAPDVITMDISMPNLNGFDATRKIMQTNPIPIVIVSGLYTENDIEAGFKAMDSGALAILSRPAGPLDPEYARMSGALIDTIKVISGIKLVTRKNPKSLSPLPLQKVQEMNEIKAIGIGASLGGPPALEKVLSKIPSAPFPIFIVQHISSGFTKSLAGWLQKSVSLDIKIPEDQEIAMPGNIYIAPDNKHMVVEKDNIIRLVSGKDKEICPSINRLMLSMAKAYEKNAIGIILTGMGQDGVEGLLAMRKKGALTIAQDAEECVMFGMPKAAIEQGASEQSLSLDEISNFICKTAESNGHDV